MNGPTRVAWPRQNPTMSEHDEAIQRLEDQFPPMSGIAFADARARVLASGQSVLQSEGGAIYRVFPDGRKEWVKQIEPPTYGVSGTIFILR